MTQEEKLILLKDLCARLPYGVKIQVPKRIETLYAIDIDSEYVNNQWPVLNYIPYLRPMSSMTEEEKEEFDKVLNSCNDKVFACPEKERRYKFFDAEQEDFMNAHHFDFRNLIERGLAIDCTGLNIY